MYQLIQKKRAFVQALLIAFYACFAGTASAGTINDGLFIQYYREHVVFDIDEHGPYATTECDIVFKFADEKSLLRLKSYSIFYNSYEKISDIEAYTLSPSGQGSTKMKKTKITDFKETNSIRNDVFYDDTKNIEFTFHGLTVGSEVHIHYAVETHELHFTSSFYFQQFLPAKEVVFSAEVPDDMDIKFIEREFGGFPIVHHTEKKRKGVLHTWTIGPLDDYNSSSDGTTTAYYVPHILPQIRNYTVKGRTIPYSDNVASLHKWYRKQLENVNPTVAKNIRQLADSICAGASGDEEKARRIYKWVQRNIRYVAFEDGRGGIVPRNAEQVCDKRYGDCKDMSSILHQLLKASGVQAHVAWIGTNDIPYDHENVPLKNVDNHMIAMVKINGNWIVLDGTDPNCVFGMPTMDIQNKQALIDIGPDKYELYTIPVLPAAVNTLTDSFRIDVTGTDVVVNGVCLAKGYVGESYISAMYYLTEKEKKEFVQELFKSSNSNFQMENFGLSVKEDIPSVRVDCKYKLVKHARKSGKNIFVNIFFDRYFANKAIDTNRRLEPFAVRYNNIITSVYMLRIPDGYQLEAMPADRSFKKDKFGFSIRFSKEGNTLICKQEVTTSIPTLLLRKDEFSDWNDMVRELNKGFNESISLVEQ